VDALGLAELLKKPLAELPRELELVPVPGQFDVVVTPPGSKSITNRALLLAALCEDEAYVMRPLIDADDAQRMIGGLEALGISFARVESERGSGLRVTGRISRGGQLDLGNAGTATRFLTAAACLAPAPVVIDGNARMRQRPIGELTAMLEALGAKIEFLGRPGFPPLRVHPGVLKGRTLTIPSTQSSQFVSAIILIAPRIEGELTLVLERPITSAAYIEMTLQMMARQGYEYSGSVGEGRLELWGSPLRQYSCDVEPDASSATYFWGAAGVVAGSRVEVKGLDGESIQSDAGFARVMREVGAAVEWRAGESTAALGGGALYGGEFDFSMMPDAAMTMAAVACFAEGTTTITGLRTLRVKETDRLAAVKNELSKIGARVEIFSYADEDSCVDEGLRITPPRGGVNCSAGVERVDFETYDDHRMAMSLALIGLRRPNVVIREPQCVAKTYSTFWRDWAGIYESGAR
jgi:3-phosphoshikimate 1-carboxyvinyltransferase